MKTEPISYAAAENASYKKWEEDKYNDEEELENNYRLAALKMMRVLHSALSAATENEIKMWGVFFAISHPYCIGRSMSDVATELGVSRASISNAAIEFCKANELPPSPYMRNTK